MNHLLAAFPNCLQYNRIMDDLSTKQRSYCMSKIRCSETKPEINFRKYLWKNGLRGYRKNVKLIGKPDIFFKKAHLTVFIDGCFWHKCPVCYKKPKTNKGYWDTKIKRNVLRDSIVNEKLSKNGYTVLRFWTHQINQNIDYCFKKLKKAYEKNI